MIGPWKRIRDLQEQLAAVLDDCTREHARADAMRDLLHAERERCDRLIAQIVDLKREGFERPPPPLEVPPADDLPDEVWAAIRERARPGTPLWDQLAAEAADLLRAEASPERVRERLLAGGDQFDDLIGG